MLHTTSSTREWGCKRRFRYKYIDKVRTVIKGRALNVGSAFHFGLEQFKAGSGRAETLAAVSHYAQGGYWDTDEAPAELARTRAMLRAYYVRWEETRDRWETLASEKTFEIELAPGLRFGGKWDYVGSNKGALYLWDHKTTSEEIGNVGEDFWQALAIDRQITAYCEAVLRVYGEMPRILWDVVRKPSSKPGMCRNADGKAIRIVKRKSETETEFAQRKADNTETLAEYEDRLFSAMLAEPDKYLVRREVHRTRGQHGDLLADLVETCNEIDSYAGTYPRNDGMCRARFGTCPYLGVCAGVEQLDSVRFEKLETAHPELTDDKGDQT